MTRALRSTLAWLGALTYRAYFATLRVRITTSDATAVRLGDYRITREVFALCERDALALAGALSRRRFAVMVAHGRDGDWASEILAAMGSRVIRGATNRGGAGALRQLVRTLREIDDPLGLVVDGPLGPSGQAKRGAAFCAIHTSRPLLALGAAARHALVFSDTWSGIYLPWPFTRVELVIDEITTNAATPSGVDVITETLTERLRATRSSAVALAQRSWW